MSANGDVELICLKGKSDPCPFKRKLEKGTFYNCIKPYTTKYPPCEWVVYQPKGGRNEMPALL